MHQIGVGVLGPVYRTYDDTADRLVAVKAFTLDLTPEQTGVFVESLNRVVGADLSHASLVAPVAAGIADGVPYLALEYVAAESLDVAMRHYAPATLTVALPYIGQLAEAIDAAHERGIVHGGLHLRDIFVTPDDALATGFGVIPALEEVGLRGPIRRPYTAPEIIAGRAWGPEADRFSLAAIAYELITGKRAAGTGDQVTERLLSVDGVADPDALQGVFATALSDVLDMRYSTAARFVSALREALGHDDRSRVLSASGFGLDDDVAPSVETADLLAGLDLKRGDADDEAPAERGDLDALLERSSDPGRDTLNAMEHAPRESADSDQVEVTVPADEDWEEDLLSDGEVPAADTAATTSTTTADVDVDDDDDEPTPGRSIIVDPLVDDDVADEMSLEAPEPVPAQEFAHEDDSEPADDETDDEADDEADDEVVFADAGGTYEEEDTYEEVPYDESDLDVEPALVAAGAARGESDTSTADVVRGRLFSPRSGVLLLLMALVVGVGAYLVGLRLAPSEETESAPADLLTSGPASTGANPETPGDVELSAVGGDERRADRETAVTQQRLQPPSSEPATRTQEQTPPSPSSRPVERAAAAVSATPTRPTLPAPPPADSPGFPSGWVLVRTTPPGATVTINGVPQGMTPLSLGGVAYGTHSIVVTLDGHGTQARDVTVDADTTVAAVGFDLGRTVIDRTAGPGRGTGSVLVDSRPPGARVMVDGQLVGETPVELPDVPAGLHQVRVERDGYVAWVTSVDVAAGERHRVAASLEGTPQR